MNSIDNLKDKICTFCEDNISMPDIDTRIVNFLFSEIVNDLNEKGITNFGEWLRYYSTEGNNFEEIVSMTESYYYKTLTQNFESISIKEKIMVFNAIGLYCIEMDIEMPTGKLLGTVILTFIEVIRHYNLFVKGYLSMKGEILISNRNKTKFYNIWTNGSNFKREVPVTLFKEN